jgi:RNA polymerase sigma-70 factor (ECF subfamily)
MTSEQPDTEELLRRVGEGNATARGQLLSRHRERLRRMVSLRLDPRMAARLDSSDVVQETLAVADRRLDGYVHQRPLPFYPWLRQLACDRMAELYRRHVRAGRRSVRREEVPPPALPDASAWELADRLLDHGDSPSAGLQREELQRRVLAALAMLADLDREVLVLRYLEQMSAREVGVVLGVSEAAAKKRALRALQRLGGLLKDESAGGR